MNYKIIKPTKEEFIYIMKINNINVSEEILKGIESNITIPYLGILYNEDKECLVSYGYAGDYYNNGIVTIHECNTIENYQGKGYFSKLFHYIVEDLEKNPDYKLATLGVDSSNTKNQEMYEKWGFKERKGVTSEWTYPDGRKETILWFEKVLNNLELGEEYDKHKI